MGALRFIVGVLGAFIVLVFSTLSFLILKAMVLAFGPWCWLFALFPSLILMLSFRAFLQR